MHLFLFLYQTFSPSFIFLFFSFIIILFFDAPFSYDHQFSSVQCIFLSVVRDSPHLQFHIFIYFYYFFLWSKIVCGRTRKQVHLIISLFFRTFIYFGVIYYLYMCLYSRQSSSFSNFLLFNFSDNFVSFSCSSSFFFLFLFLFA